MSAKHGTLEYWQEVAEAVTDDVRALRAEVERLKARDEEWQRKASAWMASPEAAQRLDGYRELAQRLNTAEAERDALRAAGEAALRTLDNVRVFVTSRERIHKPSGEEWFEGCVKALRAALEER